MKTMLTLAASLSGAVLMTGAAWAQTPPSAPAAAEAPAPMPAEPVEDWHPFSRNADRVYLADIGTIAKAEEVSTIRVARVSRRPSAPTDLSYTIDEVGFRCAVGQVRPGTAIEFGPEGTETDRYEDAGDWEAIRADTLDDYVKPYACEGARGNPPSYPSIRAFMDAGRGD